ncbi:MAG: spore germination protein GerPC [Bacilli bacterium]
MTKETHIEWLSTVVNKINELEQQIESLKSEKHSNKIEHLSVENVHIGHLHTEQFVFRIDDLSVETLSGMLNVGNNFQDAEHTLESVTATQAVNKERQGHEEKTKSNMSNEPNRKTDTSEVQTTHATAMRFARKRTSRGFSYEKKEE